MALNPHKMAATAADAAADDFLGAIPQRWVVSHPPLHFASYPASTALRPLWVPLREAPGCSLRQMRLCRHQRPQAFGASLGITRMMARHGGGQQASRGFRRRLRYRLNPSSKRRPRQIGATTCQKWRAFAALNSPGKEFGEGGGKGPGRVERKRIRSLASPGLVINFH
jgi:hypothetical protein